MKILIIEDNPTNMELMTYLLKAYGYETVVAMDGEAGCVAAIKDPPALVICDVHLPGLDGYGVLAWLKSRPELRGIPVIAVTALAMVGDRDRMLASGFDGYIAKPIEPEEFISQIRHFVGGADAPAPPPPALTPAEPAPSRKPFTHTILAVDNSPANLQYIEAALSGSGYNVVGLATVIEALRYLERSAPDLILSDVHMPGLNGFDLIREVKRNPNLRDLPIVLLSSTYGDIDAQRALALGTVAFIERPIEPEKFVVEIQALLKR